MDEPAPKDRGEIERIEAQVRGRVQGVGFRAFVQREADRLGVTGWVRNEPDGSVRAVAEGPQERLDAFLQALTQGPTGARVDGVRPFRSAASGEFDDFSVRYF